MVHTCFVCKWRSDHYPRRSFHQFPLDEKERKQWLEIIGKSDAVIGKWTSLCNIHFDDSCYRYGVVFNKKILKKGSLPSLFLTRYTGENDQPITSEVEISSELPVLVPLEEEESSPEKKAKKRPSEQIDVEVPCQKKYVECSENQMPNENPAISLTDLFTNEILIQKSDCLLNVVQVPSEKYVSNSTDSKSTLMEKSNLLQGIEKQITIGKVSSTNLNCAKEKIIEKDNKSSVMQTVPVTMEKNDNPLIIFTGLNSMKEDQLIENHIRLMVQNIQIMKHKDENLAITFTELNCIKEELEQKNKQLSVRNWKITKYEKKLAENKKKILALKRQVRRLKAQKLKYKDMIKYLKANKNKFEKDVNSKEQNIGPVLKSILSQANLNRKKIHEYPHDLKVFATTMYFLSQKAYKYVKAVLPSLPNVTTIRKWLQEIKIEQGICKTSLDILKSKATEANKLGKQLLCNVVVDDLAIRKQLRLTSGFSNTVTKSKTVVKDAMVIMVVPINEDWEVPVAHYYIDGLSGQNRADLLFQCLIDLYSTGILVTSLTVGGAASYAAMVKHLGVDIRSTENFDKYFQHPITEEPVYVIVDVSHAIKLVRNALADKATLIDINGDTIRWKYFKLLVKYQYRYGLYAVTKIRKPHVNFAKDKANEKLAIQILSNGVSQALQFLRTIQQPEFVESYATETFCTVMNEIFYLLNSKQRLMKTTPPINRENIIEIRSRITEYELYIKSLTDTKNQLILESNRKLGFIDILISLRSTLSIFDRYSSMDENSLDNLFTHKLSKDHFDLFSSRDRLRESRNIGPTEEQFQSIFRKHLIFVQVGAPDYANCFAQDNICVLRKKRKSKNKIIINSNICLRNGFSEDPLDFDKNAEFQECLVYENSHDEHVNAITSINVQYDGLTNSISNKKIQPSSTSRVIKDPTLKGKYMILTFK